jgi:hypothetical protein
MQRADPNRSAAFDQPRLKFDEGHIALFGNQLTDKVAMRLNLARVPVAAARFGDSPAMFHSALSPTDRACRADTEPFRRTPTTHPAFNCDDNSVPQVL